MSAAPNLLEALQAAVGWEALGARAGNLTLGRGTVAGRGVRVALVENRMASGALGALECEKLGALLRIAALEKTPVVLYLDSAGAKVSEGLKALGAFRALYRAGLEAAFAGAPIAAVLGRNCYGGASMLAHLAGRRLFGAQTQLAMSGPAIIASAAGMDPLDEMFRAITLAAIGASARAKASGENAIHDATVDLGVWLAEAIAAPAGARALLERHQRLGQRLSPEARTGALAETVYRRDLEKIYPGGYEAREAGGYLEGRGRGDAGEERFIGIVGKTPLGVERAWRFARAAWASAADPPPRLRVFLDCASHAARLDDEKVVLSEFIVDMAMGLHANAMRGVPVETTILGKAGGGVYVALAAPARPVSAVHGAQIQVLPGAALAAILGESQDESPAAGEYRAAGVAESELKLGLLP